jgi:hypothetical protein
MKGTKSKFLSRSGYILPDVFSELRSQLLKPGVEASAAQIEQLCYWSAELVCSGKVKQLVGMLVDLYCTCFISKNLGFVERFAKSLESIQTERFNPKSADVQSAICTLVIMLARQTPSRNPRSFATSISYSHQCFIDGLHRPPDSAANHVLKILGPSFVDCGILHILIHFWQSLHEGDASKACCLIDYVTQKFKKLNASMEGLDITIGMPKIIQTDSVWALWKLLMEYPRYSEQAQKFRSLVQANFGIFKIEYTLGNRKDRLNLLYACAIVLTTKKTISDSVFEDKVIVQALEHLNNIYQMILGKAGKSKPSQQKQKPSCSSSARPAIARNDDHKEKIQALFCYAYVKPTTTTTHSCDGRLPSQQQPQYKELDLQCGSWNPMGNDTVTVHKLDAVATPLQMSKYARTNHGSQPLSNRDRSRNAT